MRFSLKVAVVLALALWWVWPRRTVRLRSAVTDRAYSVRNLPGAQQVADRLATLETRMARFLVAATARFPDDPRIHNIKKRWNGTLAETDTDSNVAYSLSKTAVHVCVRGKNGELQDANTCTFVLLHEFAHVANDTWGHPPEFWEAMRFLLELAELTGFYQYDDHSGTTLFCGRELGVSPLACVKTGACTSALGG